MADEHDAFERQLTRFSKHSTSSHGENVANRLRNSESLIGISAWAILSLQIAFVILGYTVFPQPAIHSYLEAVSTNATSMHGLDNDHREAFALFHAAIMWLAIPQHVPTVLSSLGLFALITRLHRNDARETLDAIGDQSEDMVEILEKPSNMQTRKVDDIVVDKEIEIACRCLEKCQESLQFTCTSVKWIWLHQLFYALMLIFTTAVNLSARTFDDLSHWDGIHTFRVLLDVWQGCIGGLLVGTALVLPAATTATFHSLPRYMVWKLRKRKISITKASKTCSYMNMILVGFTVGGHPITFSVCAQFAQYVSLMLSIFAQSGYSWH